MSPIHGAARRGKDRSPTYKIWVSMRERCRNPKLKGFKNYGGRGITVCERWKSFANFLADMGEKPAGLSLDRINNNGNYEPGNCRWADRETQSRNRRNNRRLTFDGREMTFGEWEKEKGLTHGTINDRLSRNWTVEQAITSPRGTRIVTGYTKRIIESLPPEQVRAKILKAQAIRREMQLAQTHCKRGHLLAGYNVYFSGTYRQCRECANMRARRRRQRLSCQDAVT